MGRPAGEKDNKMLRRRFRRLQACNHVLGRGKNVLIILVVVTLGALLVFNSTFFRRQIRGSTYVYLVPQISFATFAFTEGSGGRWNEVTCRRAIRLMYSSLVKSQVEFPHLHVFTNVPNIIPNTTFSGQKARITAHIRRPEQLRPNYYTSDNPWMSLSRAKLDEVEDLILSSGRQVVWVDLDTLVFSDLGISTRVSWVIGYQHGSCQGRPSCSLEHISSGGHFHRPIEPRYDAFGDLWSLNLTAISAIRQYETLHVAKGLPLPIYDLQGFFSLMLQDNMLPAYLLHDILDYNYGFTCSQFDHPTPENVNLKVSNGRLSCEVKDLGHVLSENVGSMSFTAPTFQQLLLRNDHPDFAWLKDKEAASWLQSWFHVL